MGGSKAGVWALRLLGGFALVAPDGKALSLATRKGAALLSYLALAPDRRTTRERLAALLWEDADEAQARVNLRQLIATLRRLGTEYATPLIETDGEMIALAPAVDVDVAAFERAAGDADAAAPDAAAQLYRGDLLDGFSVRAAPAFADWAAIERQRLRQQALGALEAQLAAALAPDGRPEAGIAAATRLLGLDPLHEPAHRGLMRLHVRQGRPALALKQYHQLVEVLDSELRVTPEPATQALFRDIRAARQATAEAPAERHAAAEEESAEPESGASSEPTADRTPAMPLSPATLPPAPPRATRRRLLPIAVGLGVSLAVLSFIWYGAAPSPTGQETTSTAPTTAKSIAVLPFANFSDTRDAGFFADGLTEELINSLAQNADLKVAGRTSAFYFKDKNVDLREIGRRLGVAYVLEGSVRRADERVRITVQLISVRDGFHLWSQTYDRTTNDIFAVQTEIADAVARMLEVQLQMPATPQRRLSRNPEAYRLHLVARAHLRNQGLDDVRTARTLFQRLTTLEPDNPDGYAGYARATILLAQHHLAIDFDGASQAADAAVAKALRLDPQSAEAHLAKGLLDHIRAIRTSQPALERAAEQAFRRAVELDPRNPEALAAYGGQLALLDHPDRAITYLERSLAIDPLSRTAQMQLGDAFEALGQLDDAIRQYRTVAELYPDYVDPKLAVGMLLTAQGRLDQAEPWLKAARAIDNDAFATLLLAQLYADLGMTADTRAVLRSLKAPPVAAAVAQASLLQLDGDYRGVLRFAEAQTATGDPLWPDLIAFEAVLLGENDLAQRHLAAIAPSLFAPDPDASQATAEQALGVALLLDRRGDRAKAHRIVDALLATTAPKPGRRVTHDTRLARVKAFALRGDRTRALAELRLAIDAGYRAQFDPEYFIRIDAHPALTGLRDEPRFQSMMREIEEANRGMRDTLRTRRAARSQPIPG